MGAAVSALLGAARAARVVARVLGDLHRQFRDLDARINAAPGLPRPSPTRSFWFESPPHPELVDVRSATLPEQADVVIVGSGITAAAVARSLLDEAAAAETAPSVVVLEARQLCSGATGRNGGHIKASPHEAIDHLITKLGVPGARAAALVRFQLAHLQHIVALCAADAALTATAECREVDTVDLFVDEAHFREGRRMVALLKTWVPEFEMTVWSAEEARERFATGPHVVGGISYRAGALWPYRFVTSLWRRLLDSHPDALALETGTPAEAIDVVRGTHPFRVVTPRGVVRARHVVHATNAYASHLLPALRRKLTGFRAHMSAQRPGPRFPDLGGRRSWSIIYGSGFDYITQRPAALAPPGRDAHTEPPEPGEAMVGGGFVRSPGSGLDQIGEYDDTTTDLFTEIHLHGIMPSLFGPHWGASDGAAQQGPPSPSPSASQGHVKSLWSGIIAATADLVPLVGRLEPRLTGRPVVPGPAVDGGGATAEPGEWIAAGYNGDGMVWAWLSGTALGLMVAGRDQDDLAPAPGRPSGRAADWLPREMLPTPARLDRIDVTDLADVLW